MTERLLPTLLIPLLLVACGPTARVEVPTTHPANPQADESPVPAASGVLSGLSHPIPPLAPGDPGKQDHSQHRKAGATGSVPTGKPPANEDHSQHEKPRTGP